MPLSILSVELKAENYPDEQRSAYYLDFWKKEERDRSIKVSVLRPVNQYGYIRVSERDKNVQEKKPVLWVNASHKRGVSNMDLEFEMYNSIQLHEVFLASINAD